MIERYQNTKVDFHRVYKTIKRSVLIWRSTYSPKTSFSLYDYLSLVGYWLLSPCSWQLENTPVKTHWKKKPPKAAFRGRIVKAVLLAFAKKTFRNTNFIFLKQVNAAFRLFSLWNLADLIHLWDEFFSTFYLLFGFGDIIQRYNNFER